MNIAKINSSTTFYGNTQPFKEFGGRLISGKDIQVQLKLNDGGNPFVMGRRVFDEIGNLDEAKYIARAPKLKLNEVMDFLKEIQENAEGWNVFQKFTESMLK